MSAKTTKTKVVEETFHEHSFAESIKRYPVDIRLRAAGFKIERRPNKGEAVWKIGNLELSESKAIAYLNRKEVGDLCTMD